MNRVGHAFFKRRMRETNGIFGGEVTGHYYFRDNFYADNGFIPALLILELMSKKGKSLRELLEPLRAEVLHLGRDQHQARRAWTPCRRSWSRSRRRYTDAHQYTLDGISVEYPGLALQRARVEHRAAAAPEPRGEDAGADGGEARRGAGADPLVVRRLLVTKV